MLEAKKQLSILVVPSYIIDNLKAMNMNIYDLVVFNYAEDRIDKIFSVFKRLSVYDLRDMYILNDMFKDNILDTGTHNTIGNDLNILIERYIEDEFRSNVNMLVTEKDKLELLQLYKCDKTLSIEELNENNVVNLDVVENVLIIIPKIGFSNLLLNDNCCPTVDINFNEWFIENINDYVFKKINKDAVYNSVLFKRLVRLKINKLSKDL